MAIFLVIKVIAIELKGGAVVHTARTSPSKILGGSRIRIGRQVDQARPERGAGKVAATAGQLPTETLSPPNERLFRGSFIFR
jgi:hypothetical protein